MSQSLVKHSNSVLSGTGKILMDMTNVKGKKALNNEKNRKRKSINDENSRPLKNQRIDHILKKVAPPAKKIKKEVIDVEVQTEPLSRRDNNFKLLGKDLQSPAQKDEASAAKTVAMLTCEKPPAEYWEIIAEQRRQALNESLEENQQLWEENEALKRENALLEEIASEAKELSKLVQAAGLLEDDVKSSESTSVDGVREPGPEILLEEASSVS